MVNRPRDIRDAEVLAIPRLRMVKIPANSIVFIRTSDSLTKESSTNTASQYSRLLWSASPASQIGFLRASKIALFSVTATNLTLFDQWFHSRHSAPKRPELNRYYSTCALNFHQVCTGGRQDRSLGHRFVFMFIVFFFSSIKLKFHLKVVYYLVLYHEVIITAMFGVRLQRGNQYLR